MFFTAQRAYNLFPVGLGHEKNLSVYVCVELAESKRAKPGRWLIFKLRHNNGVISLKLNILTEIFPF